MTISAYYRRLRDRIGRELLLIPAVAAVVHDETGRLLVIERPSGGLSLPAGAIEPGETPQAALIRELREETGLEAEIAELLGVFGGEAYRSAYPNGDRVEFVTALFRAEVRGGHLTAGAEGTAKFVIVDVALVLETEFPRELLTAA